MPNSNKPKPKPDLKRNGTGRVRISASFKPGMEKELEMIAMEDGVNVSQALQRMVAKEVYRRSRRSKPG